MHQCKQLVNQKDNFQIHCWRQMLRIVDYHENQQILIKTTKLEECLNAIVSGKVLNASNVWYNRDVLKKIYG